MQSLRRKLHLLPFTVCHTESAKMVHRCQEKALQLHSFHRHLPSVCCVGRQAPPSVVSYQRGRRAQKEAADGRQRKGCVREILGDISKAGVRSRARGQRGGSGQSVRRDDRSAFLWPSCWNATSSFPGHTSGSHTEPGSSRGTVSPGTTKVCAANSGDSFTHKHWPKERVPRIPGYRNPAVQGIYSRKTSGFY